MHSRFGHLGHKRISTYPPPQDKSLTDSEVITLNSRTSRFDFAPGEVIVKFKASSRAAIKAPSARRFRTAGATEVDRVFAELGVTEVEELMPLSGSEKLRTRVKAYTGKDVEAPAMEKAYRLRLDRKADIVAAVKSIESLDEVEFAEPNYTVHALGGDITSPDDPYYSLQYGLWDINLPELWAQPVITKDSPVIAILDTGVDITHPDLAPNIWTNEAEASGATSYDDDGNGYTDDLHGWDFVNNTGRIGDYNGHGTHCAGIAGACGYNGLGIIGANPNARIMPLTVLQSTGQGDIATIIKAIDYAAANGAQVISMSLGTYAISTALEQALARAYQKAVVVAAAGNDGECLNHPHPERGQFAPSQVFPAAYTFVLGVQATNAYGTLASFSNYDDNGPAFSEYGEEMLYNYEIKAPGASVMSTYPGGGYKQLNGTSMATPLVAGAVSRLLQSKEYASRELLFGDLINTHTEKGNLDIAATFRIKDSDRQPSLQLVSYRLDDSKFGDDDGRVDAGETVYIYPKFRNSWGTAKNIRYSLRLGELEDPETVQFLSNFDSCVLSQLSSYASVEAQVPFALKFNESVVDGRKVKLILTATCENTPNILTQELTFTVENGIELGGVLSKDMTLSADKNYIVSRTLAVPAGITLTIEPGTVLKFKKDAGLIVTAGEQFGEEIIQDGVRLGNWSQWRNYGKVIAKGQPGKMIVFSADDHVETSSIQTFDFGYYSELEYCRFTGFDTQVFDLVLTGALYADTMANCEWLPNQSETFFGKGYARHCIIDNIDCSQWNQGNYRQVFLKTNQSMKYNTYRDISVFGAFTLLKSSCSNYINLWSKFDSSSTLLIANEAEVKSNCNNVFSNKCGMDILAFTPYIKQPAFVTPLYPSYIGTSRQDIAKENIWDINKGYMYGDYDLSNMLTRPVAEAHGIVWKVVVDGYDAQDEFEIMPPLGVGRHKFEVYFNRPMNKAVTPDLAMGVRAPYTQTAIAEDGSWNEAGDIYTAYLTISGRSSYDGLNRIYVARAEDDEYFEIPVENVRFNVNVQAAGSLSEGFTAEAGVGRVMLEWDNSEENFDDMLGYNMYRYTVDDTGVASDSIRVNERLLEATETALTDFDVVPGKTYCYYYRVMRTNMSENSPSKTVAVTPMTATAGDANGSGDVDVADVITTVNHAAGMNPKPFIFDAADMNGDREIDILDVVGIIRTILNPTQPETASIESTATYYVENGSVWLDTPVALAGVQVNLLMDKEAKATATEALTGFEQTGAWISDDEYIFMAYTMKGLTVPAGTHAILNIGEDAEIKSIKLSDPLGANVEAIAGNSTTGIEGVAAECKASAKGVFNIMGVRVADDASALNRLPRGIYIVNGQKIVK